MINDNVLRVRERIRSACERVNRDPESVTIVAITKNATIGQVDEVFEAGIADIGENKVREAFFKRSALSTMSIHVPLDTKWHLVGHLQTNKVKKSVELFDLIHSVDSLDLAGEINKKRSKIYKFGIQDILIEVKTSPETTKFGVSPEAVPSLIKEISSLKNVNIKGLMTIAPVVDNPEKARPYFRMLRELRDKIRDVPLPVLSMGMSDDFEVAIEEGATMIRLGRAIFEA